VQGSSADIGILFMKRKILGPQQKSLSMLQKLTKTDNA